MLEIRVVKECAKVKAQILKESVVCFGNIINIIIINNLSSILSDRSYKFVWFLFGDMGHEKIVSDENFVQQKLCLSLSGENLLLHM